MKKHIKIVAIVLALTTLLTGCENFGSTRLPGRKEKDIVQNELDTLLEAIEDEDVDAIIDMFAEDALDEIDEDELEESIEELIETFPDWDGWDGDYGDIKVREYRVYSRNHDSYYYYEPDFWFTVDGHDYEFHLVFVYKANKKERVGLYVIQINDDDITGYTTDGYYCRPDEDTEPGVYCWDCKIK